MDELKNLHDARGNIWHQMRALNDTVADEGREFTAEEEATWQRLNGEHDRLDAMIARALEHAENERAVAEAVAGYEPTAPAAPAEEERHAPADQFRRLASGEVRSVEFFPESRDLTKGSATAGGNTVPTSFYDQLVEHMIEVSGVLSAGPTILRTTSGESIEVPVTTAHSSGALTAEAAAISESDPAFAKRTLGAYKYATLIQVSRELVDDTGVDLEGYLARQAGRAVGNALGVDLAVGNASSKPSGIVQTATTGVTGGTGVAGAFTADNLIDLYHSVISPYRNSSSCGWIMRDATMAAVRKLKDTTNQYLWQPGLTADAPVTLLGKPVYNDPNIAAVATSAKSVVFGDIAAYFVRLAGGVRFERSDEYAFNTDLVSFRCVVRGDGILADQTGAVKVFVGAGT